MIITTRFGKDDGREVTVTQVSAAGHVELREVFTGVGIVTAAGRQFGIAQRDSGLEITCPDGTLIGVKLRHENSDDPGVYLERDCKVIEA